MRSTIGHGAYPRRTLALPGRAEVAFAQHDELIDAIQAHDVQRAQSLAKGHMQDAERIRIAMLMGDADSELADIGQVAAGSLDGTGTGSSRSGSRGPRNGSGRRGREASARRAQLASSPGLRRTLAGVLQDARWPIVMSRGTNIRVVRPAAPGAG